MMPGDLVPDKQSDLFDGLHLHLTIPRFGHFTHNDL